MASEVPFRLARPTRTNQDGLVSAVVRRSFGAVAGAVLLVLLLGGAVAEAQPVRTLVIQDEAVVLDGIPLEPESLPPSLHVAGKDLYVQFSGEAWPVVDIDAVSYRLGQGRLIELPASKVAAEAEASPTRIASLSAESRRASAQALPVRSAGHPAAVPPEAQLAADLNALRSELYALRHRASQTSVELGRRVDGLLLLAERAGETLAALPAWEVERYLQEIEAGDAALRDRLHAEWVLERDVRRLARLAANHADADERARYAHELRASLTVLFGLTQDNQRRELAQMEAELAALREELAARDGQAEALIELRLKQLLDAANQP